MKKKPVKKPVRRVSKTKRILRGLKKTVIGGLIISVSTGVGYVWSLIKNTPVPTKNNKAIEMPVEKPTPTPGTIVINENEVYVEPTPVVTPVLTVEPTIAPTIASSITMTDIENKIEVLSNDLKSRGIIIDETDKSRFIEVINIETLFNENQNLAEQIFANEDIETVMTSVGNVIGNILTYNVLSFQETGTTEKFINISNCIIGEDREKIEYLEQCSIDMSNSLDEGIPENIEIIANNMIEAISNPSTEFSFIDSGASFASVIAIETANMVGRNHLSKETRDVLTSFSGNESSYGTIKSLIENCEIEVKTRTR